MDAFEPAGVKPEISYDELEKIDIRIGTIQSVADVDGADKLVKLTVDFGDHQRPILTGLKEERENLAEIEGRQALFVVNLKPRRMRGGISEGMLFDIGYADWSAPEARHPGNLSPTAPAFMAR